MHQMAAWSRIPWPLPQAENSGGENPSSQASFPTGYGSGSVSLVSFPTSVLLIDRGALGRLVIV